MFVRVLKSWRGLPAAVFADVRGKHLREGIAEGALDDKADMKDVPGAVKHSAVLGEDDAPKTKAK